MAISFWVTINIVFGMTIPPLSLILPLGISFYTLQAVSYVIDVYRGTCKADKNFGRVLLFVCFFPANNRRPYWKI